jgi:hypothetical protein
MMAYIGRSLLTQTVVTLVRTVGLPSLLFFMAVTATAACLAACIGRVLPAIILIVTTLLIALGVSSVHAAERDRDLHPHRQAAAVVTPSPTDRRADRPHVLFAAPLVC